MNYGLIYTCLLYTSHLTLDFPGALEIKVDPYSRMLEGVVRLVVNSYWNMGMIRSESFSIASMK